MGFVGKDKIGTTNIDKHRHMQFAIRNAIYGFKHHHGGPFSAVIVRDSDDRVVGFGHNEVLKRHDPTAHGEIVAIRRACKFLGTHDLTGYSLYTTGEPCPMCLAACLWANISHIYYGCTLEDNEFIGFRDNKFDKLMPRNRDAFEGYMEEFDRDACLDLFMQYADFEHELY